MRTLLVALPLLTLACSSSPPPAGGSGGKTSLLRAIGSDAPPAAPMASFEDKGFKLAGAEYWPYVGANEPRYPEDVLWGFYPKKGVVAPGESDPNADDASREAVACAERAFGELRRFVTEHAKELDEVCELGKDKGVSRQFYLWTNDYRRAADPFPPGVRPAKLWYWKRKVAEPNKQPGFWKWESTLTQRGECTTPNVEAALGFLRDKKAELSKTP